MARPAAILIVGPNWVGDMVMAEPLAKALAEAHHVPVDVLAPPTTAEVARRFPSVRNVIGFDFSPHRPELARRRALAERLRGHYGAAYVLPGSWISALAPALAGIPERVGYLRELRFGLLNRIVRLPRGSRRRTAANYLRLAGMPQASGPRLTVAPQRQAELLATNRIDPGRFVVIAPGATGGMAKRWPVANYADLAGRLCAAGERVVLLGAPGDAELTGAIAQMALGVLDLVGRTSMSDAIDLMAAARAAVANDSGLLHVAAAVGTPVVGIFGPTSPDNTAPAGRRDDMLWQPPPCGPCHQKICPLGHHNCMRSIVPEDVMARLAAFRDRAA